MQQRFYLTVILAAALSVLSGCGSDTAEVQPPLVRTMTVGDASSTETGYSGTVRGRYETRLAFQVGGQILSRNVDAGTHVRAGDVLMVIDARDVQQQANATGAGVAAARSRYELARTERARYEELYAAQAISAAMLDQYRTNERAAEAALRPKRLEDFTGQEVVRGQLSVVLRSALARGVTADHVLLSGPPGLGKTTLAMIIAAEVDGSLRLTSGPAIQHAGDLAAILSSLEEGDVLFIDEIHRLARTAEEMLYLAMEDFRVDIVVGKGPGATSIPLSLPPFTVVGATTRAGLLPAPLRDRFGFTGHLDYYGPGELTRILTRSAGLLGVNLEADAAKELASRSRGTPRIANRLLRRVQDWAEVHGRPGHLDLMAARGALDVFEVDALGLDRLDRQVLEALCTRFGGGPVGLTTLAVSVGEEPETVETVAEPYLVREGLVVRTPRGRAATAAAYTHLGLEPPTDGALFS